MGGLLWGAICANIVLNPTFIYVGLHLYMRAYIYICEPTFINVTSTFINGTSTFINVNSTYINVNSTFTSEGKKICSK